MPPLHMLDTTQRQHIITAPIADLDVEELPHRRMYDGLTITLRDGFTIARYASLPNVLYVYDGEMSKDETFFRRSRLTPFGMVRAYREFGRSLWRIDKDGHEYGKYPTSEDALNALIHYYDNPALHTNR